MLSRTGCVSLLAILAVAVAACSPSESGPPRFDQRPLATVNGDDVTVSEYLSSYVSFLISTGLNDEERTRRIHLENSIDDELLAQEATRRSWRADSLGRREAIMQRRLAVGGRFFEEAFVETLPPPTDAELRQTFALWQSERTVRHLYFTHPDEAQQSFERLEAGTDFLEEAAYVYGLADIDSTAGYLGPIRYFQMDDAFSEAAFELAEGSYSAPVRTRFGWHIIKVDRVLFNPLLTETEFQNRRSGLSSQFRLRRRRLEGDRFIRGFMEGLEVEVDAPAIRGMASLLDDLSYEVYPQPTILNPPEAQLRIDAEELRRSISPDTPLLRFRYRGSEAAFTAREYVEWLPYLSFQEALNRTGASVGRALRNEILAREGELRGLDDDEADVIVDDEMTQFLATRMRDSLRLAPESPSDSLVAAAIERLELASRGFAEPSDSLRRALAPAIAEYELLSALRRQADISVDEALFLELQDLERADRQRE